MESIIDYILVRLYSIVVFFLTALRIRNIERKTHVTHYDDDDDNNESTKGSEKCAECPLKNGGGDESAKQDEEEEDIVDEQANTIKDNSNEEAQPHRISHQSIEDGVDLAAAAAENSIIQIAAEEAASQIPPKAFPRLSHRSDSVRVRRRTMEHLDDEQRSVMLHFDQVLRDVEVDEVSFNSETTTKPIETPIFTPPPPPPANETEMKPYPRLCQLEKQSPSDEFGFNLHAEKNKGHFIGTVDEGGIGQTSGLVMGQRIVGVNGTLIYPTTPHKEVVALIKKKPLATTLLVASESVDKWYKENGAEYSFDHAEHFNEPIKNIEPVKPIEISSPINNNDYKPADQSYGRSSLNPHSIQVNEEREISTTVTKTQVKTNTYQYQDTNAYTPYDNTPSNDDLLNQVFSSVELPTMDLNTNGEKEKIAHRESTSSSSSRASSHRESAVDVPQKYVPSYVSPQQTQHQSQQTNISPPSNHYHQHTYSDERHHQQQMQQPSPLSNGSSHGYASSASYGYEDDDIYSLPAKQAREILRNKHRKHHMREMSLNEKYQLVSNM